jgi:SP family sugar:H+ symporter-like MFS transporter
MISIFQCWTSIGALIGTIIDNFTAKMLGKNSYIIPLGLVYIIPVILCAGMFFIPESPRWLLEQHKREKAHKALLWLRPDSETASAELEEIQAAMDMEENLAAGASVWDMFTNPVDRRRTVLAVCAVTLQAASGAMYMIGMSDPEQRKSTSLSHCSQHTERTSSRWPMSETLLRIVVY